MALISSVCWHFLFWSISLKTIDEFISYCILGCQVISEQSDIIYRFSYQTVNLFFCFWDFAVEAEDIKKLGNTLTSLGSEKSKVQKVSII